MNTTVTIIEASFKLVSDLFSSFTKSAFKCSCGTCNCVNGSEKKTEPD